MLHRSAKREHRIRALQYAHIFGTIAETNTTLKQISNMSFAFILGLQEALDRGIRNLYPKCLLDNLQTNQLTVWCTHKLLNSLTVNFKNSPKNYIMCTLNLTFPIKCLLCTNYAICLERLYAQKPHYNVHSRSQAK